MKMNEVSFAKNMKSILSGLAFCLAIVSFPAWANVAGHMQFVNGDVRATDTQGVSRILKKGDAVSEGDTLITARASTAQVKMQDGGFIAVRANTRMKLDQFKFGGKPDGKDDRSFFSVFKGGFRAVTGMVGRTNHDNYRVTTPTSTIGIRGTDYEVVVAEEKADVAMAETSWLLAQTDAPAPVNLVVFSAVIVNQGMIKMSTSLGEVFLKPGQGMAIAYVNKAPVVVPVDLKIFPGAGNGQHGNNGGKDQKGGSGGEGSGGEGSGGEGSGGEGSGGEGSGGEGSGGEGSGGGGSGGEGSGGGGSGGGGSGGEGSGGGDAGGDTGATRDTTVVDPVPTTFVGGPASPTEPPIIITKTTFGEPNMSPLPAPIQQLLTSYGAQAQTAAAQAQTAANNAQTAANAAATANTTLAGLALVSTAPATAAIGTTTASIGTATSNVNTATALTGANAATATANALSVNAAAATAGSQALAAQTAFTANGTFADTLAVTANSLINAPTTGAATLVTNNNALVQTAGGTAATVGSVAYFNAALTSAQGAATTALNSATAGLTSANGFLSTANTQNAAITTAQGAGATQLTAAQTAAVNAQTAAAAALVAANQAVALEAAGNITGAQQQLAIAQALLVTAQTELAAAQAAQAAVAAQLAAAQNAQSAAGSAVINSTNAATTANTDAGTASTQAAAAQTADTNSAAALTVTNTAATGSAANAVQSQAAIIANNAPVAAYNNPAVTGGQFVGVTMLSTATTGGNTGFIPNQTLQANTTYVLDGGGNLVEMRNAQFQVQANPAGNVLGTPITAATGADIKWSRTLSNTVGNEVFKLLDNSIYGGRWVNPVDITVTDNATAIGTTYGQVRDSVWAVILPPTKGYVQTLLGDVTYTMAAATTPVDSAGATGTLTNATLTAHFTTQLVDAVINLTMGSGTMAGAYTLTATGMPIQAANAVNPSGFSVMAPIAATCTGTCTYNPTSGYSADIGGSFAGVQAASAGLSYQIWPTVAAGTASPDTVHGLVAFTTATAPTALPSPLAVAGNPLAGNYSFEAVAAGGGPTVYSPLNPWGGALVNTAFGLDASNNLTEVNQTGLTKDYFAGGVALDTWKALDNSIYLGRWQGGTMTKLDLLAINPPVIDALGAGSAHWIVSSDIPLGYAQTLVGASSYSLAAATAPTDAAGNAGSLLNTSSITVDFTTQLVNMALNVQFTGARTSTFNVTTPGGIPITSDTIWGLGTVACTGTCDAGGYDANLWGRLAGGSASSIALAYHIVALSSADIVQGAAAFSAATAPAVTRHPVAGTYGRSFGVPYPVGGSYQVALPQAIGYSPNPGLETSIVLDGGDNVIGMLGTPFEVSGGATPTLSIANANVSWSGGVALDSFQSIDSSITFGRWQGGIVNVVDLAVTAPLAPISIDLNMSGTRVGPTSSMWAYVVGPAAGYVQSLSGTSTYTMTGSTAPYDTQGGMGTLNSATLSVDFTAQLVSATLQLTMTNGPFGTDVFNVIANNMPITQEVFGASYLGTAVTCSIGPCTEVNYIADIKGGFAGTTASNILLGYGIAPAAGGDIINGYAAFAATFAPYTANQTSIAYASNDGYWQWGNSNGGDFTVPPQNVTYGVSAGFDQGAPVTTVDTSNCNVNCTTTTSLTGYVQTVAPTTVGSMQYGAGTVSQITHTQVTPMGAGAWAPATWMYGPAGYLDTPTTLSAAIGTGAVVGSFSYVADGNSLPYDVQTKQTGSITAAFITADFATSMITVGVSLTMTGNTWDVSVNTPIAGNWFSTSNPGTTASISKNAVACAGTTCGGMMQGGFTGQNYAGLMLSYQLNDYTTGQSIAGLGPFVRDTGVAVANGTPVAPTSYFVADQGGYVSLAASVNGAATPPSPGQLLTSVTFGGGGGTTSTSVVCNTCGTYGSTNVANTGIYYGTWDIGTYTNSSTTTPPAGAVSWITGPQTAQPYLSWVLTGAANYTLAGQTPPSDNLGSISTVANLTSATLSVDFAAQTVAVALGISLGPNVWTASGTSPLMGRSQGIEQTAFYMSSYNGSLAVNVTPVAGGTPAPANGYISGQLVGADLSGAILSYALTTTAQANGAAAQNVSGVAAFTGPAQNAASAYRMVGASVSSATSGPGVAVGFDAASRVTMSAGALTAADIQFVTKSGSGNSKAAAIGTNTNVDVGSDLVTGISWGRWSGGSAILTDRATAAVINDATTGSGVHWIATPVATGPVTLPTTGTYTYTMTGGTLPTDNLGNVGAALPTATLTANFATQTVNVGVAATVATTTLSGSATNVPIMSGAAFAAGPNMSTPLTVTCSGTCGASAQGSIVGGFVGTGGTGAAMMYSLEKLNAAGANLGSIHGVAAFRR